MKNIMIAVALLLSFASVSHAAAVGSRGGKKSVARMIDSSGGPILTNDDKPWKVFESTITGQFQVTDESGVAPKQGMVSKVCMSTAATNIYVVVYDTNTTSGVSLTSSGIRLGPPLLGSTTLAQCLTLNALFTSGLVIEFSTATPYGGGYVYWRELGGYR